MKRTLIYAVALLTAAAALAAVPEGTHEFRAGIATDFEDNDGNEFAPIYGGVGYFFRDNIEGGLYFSFRKTDWESYWGEDSAWGIGIFGEYLFEPAGVLVPFVTARIGVLDGDETDDTSLNLAGGGGARVFITQNFSVSLQLELEWSEEDVYDYDRETETSGSGDNTDITARFGVRYFF